MSDQEFHKLIEENKDNLKEMFRFWEFIQSLNKVLKWTIYIGAPIAIGLFGIYKWIKQ